MDTRTVEGKPVAARESSGSERRKHPRFACDGAAEVIVNDAEFLFRGEICDLSFSGCFVRSRARLRLRRNQKVELYFNLSNEQVKCQAQVMSIRAGKGVGFEFLPLCERALKSIRVLVQRLEDDARLAAATSASAAADSRRPVQTGYQGSTPPAPRAGN